MFYAKTSRFPALVCSIMLHTGLVALVLYALKTAVMPEQQIIDISLVAVSSPEIKPEIKKEEPKQETKSSDRHPALDAGSRAANWLRRPSVSVSDFIPRSPHETENTSQKPSAITKPIYDAVSLHNSPPPYPQSARNRGIEGEVSLTVEVTKDGNAKEVSIAHSSGYAILDRAASDSISNWHFIPARNGDEMIEASVEIPIKFQLD